MSGITGARDAIAEAVSTTGMVCQPYAPDSINPPIAFVDSISVDYSSGAGYSFCAAGEATATVILAGQRHDRAASLQQLEDLAPAAINAIEALPGARVISTDSGNVEAMGQSLPSVLITIRFSITD